MASLGPAHHGLGITTLLPTFGVDRRREQTRTDVASRHLGRPLPDVPVITVVEALARKYAVRDRCRVALLACARGHHPFASLSEPAILTKRSRDVAAPSTRAPGGSSGLSTRRGSPALVRRSASARARTAHRRPPGRRSWVVPDRPVGALGSKLDAVVHPGRSASRACLDLSRAMRQIETATRGPDHTHET
jgi:hypothetical protein